MTDTLTTSSDVIVAVDAATAFKAFTEEMDLLVAARPDQLLE